MASTGSHAIVPALPSVGAVLVGDRGGRIAGCAVARRGRFSETSDAAEFQVLDDCVRDRLERVVVAMDTLARPERAGLRQRALDIEQELVPRKRAQIVVHRSSIA